MQNQIDKTSFLLLTNFSEKEKEKKNRFEEFQFHLKVLSNYKLLVQFYITDMTFDNCNLQILVYEILFQNKIISRNWFFIVPVV